MPDPRAARPAAAPAVRRAYRDLMAVGYLLYGVGAISPFLREALSLTDAETGLHSSLLAVGFLGAGVVADRADRWQGTARVHALAAGLAMLACLLLAWSPALAVTLGGAAIVGLTAGILLGHVNAELARGGGPDAQLRLTRANLLAMLSAQAVPLVIAGALAIGVDWQLVFVPALILLGLAIVGAQAGAGSTEHPPRGGPLPLGYWLRWCLLAVVVAIEFAVVFWGATLIERRSRASLGDAAVAGSAFFAGMIAGRSALSLRAAGHWPPMLVVRVGLVAGVTGALLAWAANDPLGGAAGLFVVGLGIAGQYPLVASMTLAAGSASPATAAARMTLATGVALLLSPLILGAIADARGVEGSWMLVPALCVAALVVSVPAARERPVATSAART